MANVPPNDPNVDASAIVSAPVNPDRAPTQPVGLGNSFAPHWIGDNIPNNKNGWIEEYAEEEEEDPEDLEEDSEEDPEEDDDDDMEMDDEAKVNDPYMDDGSNNLPPQILRTKRHLLLLPLSLMLMIVLTGPMCPNLGTAWKRFGKMEKLMSKRIDTKGRMKKKFKEQDRHFVGLGCDNIEMNRAVRNVMSDLSGLKKIVKDLSDRFNETMPPRKSIRENLPPLLTHDTVNCMIQESVEATVRDKRERVQNEANRAEGPNVAPVNRECTFANFMKCSPITFRGNEGAVGVIKWIENTRMVFTVSKCTEANKVVFVAATFHDWALTWWNSQVATIGIEVVTRKTWAEMKVMMTKEFCPPKEIQRMEGELWNLGVKEIIF
nr:hypothetical protein [Tanacetum cinerariifolium]